MANGQTHPPGHALLKVKQDQRHPPPTPPNVSVEAIKRSLVHTPSPRRFKKLRLRRLQKRLMREMGTQQIPLVDTCLEQVMNRKKENQGEDSGDTVDGLQNDMDDGLDELDLAVLNIGLGDDYVQPGSPVARDQSLPRNLGACPQTPKRDTSASCQVLRADDAGSGACKEVKKKRGPKGRTRKRQLRRLPVDELVLGPERVEALSLSNDDVAPGELSQDPISQLSSTDATPRHHKPTVRKLVKTKSRKRFGEFDISKFRFPRPPQNLSLEDRHFRELEARFDYPDTPTYADGFEGDEAFPIGRPMPTSQRGRHPSIFYNTKPSKCELTFVAEKDFGSGDQIMSAPHHLYYEQPQPGQKSFVRQDGGLGQFGLVLTEPFLDDEGTRNVFRDDEEASDAQEDLSAASDIGTPRSISSPLTRKQSHMRRVRFSENFDEQYKMHQPSVIDISLGKTRRDRGDGSFFERRSLQSPDLVPSSLTGSIRQRKDKLDVLQELAMVSVYKRIDSSDTDESGDGESSLDDEVHSEMYLSAATYEQYDDVPGGMDSGDEGDVEMEEDTIISQVEYGSQEANGDDIDDSEPRSYRQKDSQLSEGHAGDGKRYQEARDIWRPRKPRITNNVMEVDDEIVNTPEVSRALGNGYDCGRRLLEGPSQALTSTTLPTGTAYNSQFSIELGDSQKLTWQSPEPSIPETQLDDEPIDAEKDNTSKYTFVPQEKYFSRASKQLGGSAQSASLPRMNSLPSRLGSCEVRDDFTDGEIAEPQVSNSIPLHAGKRT